MLQHIIKTHVYKTCLPNRVYRSIPSNIRCILSLKERKWNTYTVLRSSSTAQPLQQTEEFFKRAKPFSQIPGTKSFIGLIRLTTKYKELKDFNPKRLHIFFNDNYKEFGPIYRLYVPFQPTVVICKPEDIENLYRVTVNNPLRRTLQSIKKIRHTNADNYFEKKGGLIVEDNEEWRRIRSRVQTPMMKPKNVIQYLPQMDEVTLEFMERISYFQSQYNEMPENFLHELYKWALESVSLIALNRRLGGLDPNLSEDSIPIKLINAVQQFIERLNDVEVNLHYWKLFPTQAYKKLVQAHDIFLEIADSNIREAEKALKQKMTTSNDEEQTLMESLFQQEGLSRKDVVTFMVDMLFGGIHTTSHTLAFTLYCLARNSNAQRKLQEEVDNILGEGKDTLTKKDMARLSYLKACVKEAMRIFPPTLGVVRILDKDTVFSGYNVPKGTQVMVGTMNSGWDEKNFKRATEYLPERWSRSYPLGPINYFASLPFSHGSRMCIGRRIAEQEIYTFLARVFHRYSVEYHYEDMDMEFCLVNVPTRPLKFKFIERRN